MCAEKPMKSMQGIDYWSKLFAKRELYSARHFRKEVLKRKKNLSSYIWFFVIIYWKHLEYLEVWIEIESIYLSRKITVSPSNPERIEKDIRILPFKSL